MEHTASATCPVQRDTRDCSYAPPWRVNGEMCQAPVHLAQYMHQKRYRPEATRYGKRAIRYEATVLVTAVNE